MTKEEVISKLVAGGYTKLATDLDQATDIHVEYLKAFEAICASREFAPEDYKFDDGPRLHAFPDEAMAAVCAAANAENVKRGGAPDYVVTVDIRDVAPVIVPPKTPPGPPTPTGKEVAEDRIEAAIEKATAGASTAKSALTTKKKG